MGTGSVEITGGTKTFGQTAALRHIDLSIGSGEFLAILGRSGSGKSTLLRVLAGLDSLSAGTVHWPGGGGRPRTGLVFQDPTLLPWLTVGQNIAFARRFAAQRSGFTVEYAQNLTERFGLAGIDGRYPAEVSGGQAQRAAILRAVAARPHLLLLDEPFSALDPATRQDLRAWLTELAAEIDITIVLVTHDVSEAVQLADRIVLLADGSIRRQWQLDAASRDGLLDDILAEYRHTDPLLTA